jgi:hypothetical protein
VPTPGGRDRPARSGPDEIAAFLEAARRSAPAVAGRRGRLVFALDATMSRQPTWDSACDLTAEMFATAAQVGGLDVKLVYFRGADECRASRWIGDARALATLMRKIDCRGGMTQIGRVLGHVLDETRAKPVDALVYVGDAMEEDADAILGKAGELALHNVPVFLFQEGGNAAAGATYAEIARLTRGAHVRFGPGAAAELGWLLRAVAAYAAGGRAALLALDKGGEAGARLLLEKLGGR